MTTGCSGRADAVRLRPLGLWHAGDGHQNPIVPEHGPGALGHLTADRTSDWTPVVHDAPSLVSRRMTTAQTPYPRTHLLSNRQYSVMVTNSGAGWSTWKDLAVTRWREDASRDCFGSFCYLRDLDSGAGPA